MVFFPRLADRTVVTEHRRTGWDRYVVCGQAEERMVPVEANFALDLSWESLCFSITTSRTRYRQEFTRATRYVQKKKKKERTSHLFSVFFIDISSRLRRSILTWLCTSPSFPRPILFTVPRLALPDRARRLVIIDSSNSFRVYRDIFVVWQAFDKERSKIERRDQPSTMWLL